MRSGILKSLILISLIFIFTWDTASGQSNEECYECHTDPDLTSISALGDTVSAFIDTSVYNLTIHHEIELECISCHLDIEEIPHNDDLEAVDCSVCHDDVEEIYKTSIHGQLLAMGDKAVPVCYSCHGKHDIFPAKDSRSKVNKFKLMYTCASCHQSQELIDSRIFPRQDAIPQFYESVHAKGLIRDGLIVAPSCNDCHGTHEIQNSANPASPVNPRSVYKTCGVCHTKVEEIYKQSVHGQLVESGDRRGPVCINCHESHKIISPEIRTFKQHSDEKCGQCHEDMLERYHETFHGKAMALGAINVAACYDCHGYHDIKRTEDPESHIHPDNKIETCKKCHEGTNANFSNYITHANHLDRENHPQLFYAFISMTILLLSVFVFFGLHTLLWVIRSIALYIRDSKTFREAKIKIKNGDLAFIRFSPLERFLHIIMIISFTTLALTGIPLKFYYADWAGVLIKIFGGVENAGYLHRVAALMLISIFFIHVVTIVKDFIPKLKTFKSPSSGRFSFMVMTKYLLGPESIIPSKRDFIDFWNHQKWFFGKGEKPKFDIWTYWEKFDYFAVFWGVVFIGLSGLIMWFPIFFTKFVPGWMINVALIIHSDEALLAAGFIFTFHFFNVHFRIEKFPMDTVIFSGRISKAELKEERAGWLERLERNESLDTIKVKDEWEGWQPIVKTFGFIAFGSGIVLAVAIFTAMLARLIGN